MLKTETRVQPYLVGRSWGRLRDTPIKMPGHYFGWADYLVLTAVLVLCLILGIIPACTGGKQKTTAEYLAGDRKLSLLPMAISLSVSYISGVTMLGFPAETFFYSIQVILVGIGTGLAALITAYTFVPVMYATQTSSVNKYLYRRFLSKTVQYLGTFFLAVNSVMISAVVITAPAFFMETVTNLPVWGTVVLMGGLSTLYTCLGGLKAVVWTDALQAGIIFTGMLSVLIKGTLDTGSVQKTWDLYSRSGQLKIDCALLQIPCGLLYNTMAALCGVVAYGYYASLRCDPLSSGEIHSVNQIIPYMVMDIMRIPGLPGLFFSGLVAASLSNLSSNLVVFSQIIWEDLLSEKLKIRKEITKTYILKALVVLAGALATGVTFILLEFKGSLLQMVYVAIATTVTPLTVLFFLAGAWPLANNKAAILSSLLACALIGWIAIGAQINKQSHNLPVSTIGTSGCATNMTILNDTSTLPNALQDSTTPESMMTSLQTTMPEEAKPWEAIYRISIYWYIFLGGLFGFIIGIVLTAIPAFRIKEKIDERYIFPCLRRIFKSHLIRSELVPTTESKHENHLEIMNGI